MYLMFETWDKDESHQFAQEVCRISVEINVCERGREREREKERERVIVCERESQCMCVCVCVCVCVTRISTRFVCIF